MDLELRHLRMLCAIADSGSVGRAAAALGLTQPTVSSQLHRIERLLDEGLFIRSGTGVELTAFGAEFVSQARDVLVHAGALGRRCTSASTLMAGTLRLGVTNTPVVPALLDTLRGVCPDSKVSVCNVYATGEPDAALGVACPGMPLPRSSVLTHRAIDTVPIFVAMPTGRPPAHSVEVPLEGLSEDTWSVASDDGVGWPDTFYDACRAAGFKPADTHEFHVISAIC